MSMAQLLLCTLCDDVRFELGNKHTLVGLFDTFNVADFTQPLPSFRVFARIALDSPGPHAVGLHITNADGDFRVEVAGRLEARTPSEVSGRFESVFAAALSALRVPRPGRYDVRVLVDGQEIGGSAFLAVAAGRQTLQ
jgi:hypothetical protein